MLVSAFFLMSGTDFLTTGQSPFKDEGEVKDMGVVPELLNIDMLVPQPVVPLPFEPIDTCTCHNKDMPLSCVCYTRAFSRVKITVPFLPKERSMLIVKKKYKRLGEKVVESSDTIIKDLGWIKEDLNAIKLHYLLEDGDVKHDHCK